MEKNMSLATEAFLGMIQDNRDFAAARDFQQLQAIAESLANRATAAEEEVAGLHALLYRHRQEDNQPHPLLLLLRCRYQEAEPMDSAEVWASQVSWKACCRVEVCMARSKVCLGLGGSAYVEKVGLACLARDD